MNLSTQSNKVVSQQTNKPVKKSMHYLRLLFMMMLFGAVGANAQISVTGGSGLAATYASFTNAGGLFAAINATAQTGNNIVVTVTGDISAEAGTTSLNAGVWATINITPVGTRIVSGTVGGAPMINLNGADNVTINGLNTGGNSLTISNLSTVATTLTSTIRFIADATNNTITNCSILGSATMAVGTNGGNIFFHTGTTTGNDNNTISNNTIGAAGANLPTKGIYGNGSTTTLAIGNSGNIITNNNFENIFGAAVSSAGIYNSDGCNTWQITNNRFYQTGTRTWTTGAQHSPIWLIGTTATSGSQGHTITGNIIGYASNTQTGTYTLTGTGTGARFVGIFFNGASAGTASTISNNTIAAVSMTGVTANGTGNSTPFTAMNLQEGTFVSSGNTIGSQSATGSLTFSTTTTSATDVMGIHNFSSNTWTSSSNNIGGISVTNLGASGTILVWGLKANTGTAVTWTANSNNIGGTVANSIQLTATGTSSQIMGMQSLNAPASFTSNTIRNIATNIGTGTTTTASVIGICLTSSTPNNTLSQNTIYNLSNSNASAASVVTGIQFTGGTGANNITRNNIYGLTVATTSSTAEVNGIRIAGGTATYANNMIAVGAGIANAAIVNGINEPSATGTDNFYHNSVYIGGSPAAGTGNSFAFNSLVTTNVRNFRNNIFVNARNNSGATGKNYAVQVGGTAPNPSGLTINYNVYNVSGAGGVFGRFNALDVASLAAWKTAVGQDANSISADPVFADPTNATPNLHIGATPTPVEGSGVAIGTVTDDFDGQTRSGLTPTDIGADAGNFTAAPSMTYVSSNAVQLTANGCAGASNVQVLRMEVVTTGALNPLTLTSLTVNGNGTSAFGDVATYRIYYTGTSSTFSTSNPIIAAAAGLSGSNVVVTPSGTVTLASGTNYFWLVYNLNTAVTGPSVDGEFTNVALSTGGGTPTVTAPAGVVNIFANPTASASSNTPICAGGTLNLTGVTDIGTSFAWTGPNSFASALQSPSITGATIAAAGTYNFTATANGCSSTTATTVVAVNATPVAPTTTGYSICLNATIPANQGLVTTTVGAGALTGSQTINFNVAGQPTETNAAPGNVVSSASMTALPTGATVTGITITYNSLVALGSSFRSDIKLGLSGALVNTAASDPLAAASAGTFNYLRTATTGITATNAGGTVNLLYWDDVSDNAGAEATFPTGSAVASVTVNYSYPDPASVKWYSLATGGTLIGTGTPFNPIGVDPALPNSSVSGTYTYYAEISNGGCPSVRTAAALQIGAALSATASSTPNTPVCAGTSVTLNGAAVGGSSVFTYSWKVGVTEVSTAASFSVTPGSTTTYDLTIMDACSQTATASVTVTVNPLPAVTTVTGGGTFCTSTTINAANGNDGTMYFQGTTSNGTSTATPAISAVITGSGTYYFRAQSAAGCWGPQGSAVVTIQAPASITTTDASVCQGGSGTVAAVSGTGCVGFVNSGTTFGGTWAATPIANRPNTSSNSTTCGFSSTITRNYAVTTFQVSVAGSYSFEMNNNAAFDGIAYLVSGAFVPGTCPGAGTFIKGDDDGAAADDEPLLTATLATGVTYTLISTTYSTSTGTYIGSFGWTVIPPSGGVILLQSSGNIEWYTAPTGGSSIGTGSPFNPVGVAGSGLPNTNTPGTTVFYAACSNSSACRTPVNFVINPNSTITLTSATGTDNQAACFNTPTPITEIKYSVGGGGTGAGATGLPPGVTGVYNAGEFKINGTPTLAGTYNYTVTTTGGGCTQATATGTIIVNAPPTATYTVGNVSVCGGVNDGSISVVAAGGTAPYTYSWTGVVGSGNPATTPFTAGNVAALTGLQIGYYNVTITDAVGCPVTITGIHVQYAFSVVISNSGSNTSSCGNTGTIILYGNAGVQPYTYALDGGAYQAGNTFTGLAAGSHTGYVKDAKGCISTKSITVNAAAAIVVSPFVRNASSCSPDGSIEVYRTGGIPPYTYSKDGISYQASNVFSGLAAGSYTVYVKDGSNCVGSSPATVLAGTGLTATTSKVNTSSCVADGSIQVSVTGGIAPYTYSKDNGATYQPSNSFSPLAAGNYAIKVKDSKGCTSGTINVTINVNTINVTSSVTNASSCATSNGSIQLFRTGGTGPYTYSLDGNTYQASASFTGKAAGTYDGYVQDSKGCIGVQSGIVVGPSCPGPVATTKGAASTNTRVMANSLKVQAYPNPTASAFTLKLEGYSDAKVNIVVTDIMGRVVYQSTGSANKSYSFGSSFKAGVYNVQVMQGEEKQTVKLVKE